MKVTKGTLMFAKTSLLTLTALALVGFQTSASAGLVWHSALDGDATAIVGPDGVAVGSPTAIADMNGNLNGAVQFDGANDYFDLGIISSTLSAGSMSFWARTEVHGNDRGPVAMGISGGGASEYFITQDRGDGRWRTDVDAGSPGRRDAFDNDPPVPLGTWHHVAATFAAGGDLKIYINGTLQDDVQGLLAGHDLENLGNWQVGAERVGGRYYNGALDDVRLYDNELSADDVSALFDAGPQFGEIPEPSTLILAALAVFGLLGFARRRRR